MTTRSAHPTGDLTGDSTGVRAAKAAARLRLRRRLAGLDPAAARQAAAVVAERTLALPEVAGARRVLTCLSFGGELDTWGLAESLASGDREIFVPRADAASGRLSVHPYPCELETLSFGLRQPRRGGPELAEAAIDALDVVLVLGLGFDRHGIRLGYGRGYFDRFLAGRSFPAVGLAFRVQIVDRLPAEPHDVPMAVVVTEGEVVRPG